MTICGDNAISANLDKVAGSIRTFNGDPTVSGLKMTHLKLRITYMMTQNVYL